MDVLIWEGIRAAGLLAYGLLSLAVLLGLGIRTRALDWLVQRGWVNELHQSLSVAALGCLCLHVCLILLNSHVAFGLSDVLIPLAASWNPLAVALGVVAMYLVAGLVLSSWARPWLGQRTWRAVHYSSFVAWLLALGHGLFTGTDAGLAWTTWLYLTTGIAVFCLLAYRVMLPPTRRAQAGAA